MSELNEVEQMLRRYHKKVFFIKSKTDLQDFISAPQRYKLLFVYMKGCGPCHRTAPELAKLMSNELLIGCFCSDHFAWLLEPSCPVKFKAIPEGFPHLELYSGTKPLGELNSRSSLQMRDELQDAFPTLKGKIEIADRPIVGGVSGKPVGKTHVSISKRIGGTTLESLKAGYTAYIQRRKQQQQQEKEKENIQDKRSGGSVSMLSQTHARLAPSSSSSSSALGFGVASAGTFMGIGSTRPRPVKILPQFF